MMFGGPQAAPAPSVASAANRTMVFGSAAPVTTSSPPAPAANRTMMFGAPGKETSASAAPAANRTMMFGAVEPAVAAAAKDNAPAAVNRTMMFGAPGQEAPASAAPAANRTMMFGAAVAPAIAPAVAPAANKTMMFGAGVDQGASKPSDVPAANRTMMFGAVAPVSDAQAEPAAEPAAAANRTMMFGSPVAVDAPESTANKTVLFGKSPLAEVPAPKEAGFQRTVRMDADQIAKAQKNLFPEQDATIPAGPGLLAQFDAASTLPPDEPLNEVLNTRPSRKSDRAQSTLKLPTDISEEPFSIGSTLGGISAVHENKLPPLRVDLPPEEPSMLRGGNESEPVDENADLDAMRAVHAASARRTKIVVAVILLLALLAGAAVIMKMFASSMEPEVAPQAAAGVKAALLDLRADDAKQQKNAYEQLKSLVDANPKFTDGRSALVVAVAARLDDTRFWVERDEKVLGESKRLLDSNPSSDSSEALKKKIDVLTPQVEEQRELVLALDAQLAGNLKILSAAHAAMPADAPHLETVSSALAFGRAVQGDDSNLDKAGSDSWGRLALPEFALRKNERLDDALAALTALKEKDTTFMRSYMLLARTHVAKGQVTEALGELETLLALQGSHEGANRLKAELTK
jgi:tetratricopeptide (TPR) repeat protein